MRPRIFSVLAACAVLTGCASLSEADRTILTQHRVSPTLIASMSRGRSLSLADIIELSEHRLPPSFILRYIRSTYAVYRLSSSDVITLRRAGVSPVVIDYLLTTPEQQAARDAALSSSFIYDDDWLFDPGPHYYRSHGHHRHH